MRKVVLYQLLSLDGVAEEPGDWVGYWPTSDSEPFASFINAAPKHVFTSSTPTEEWANTTFVSGPAADYVAD